MSRGAWRAPSGLHRSSFCKPRPLAWALLVRPFGAQTRTHPRASNPIHPHQRSSEKCGPVANVLYIYRSIVVRNYRQDFCSLWQLTCWSRGRGVVCGCNCAVVQHDLRTQSRQQSELGWGISHRSRPRGACPAASADLCLFATGGKTYGMEKLRTYKTGRATSLTRFSPRSV